MTRAPDDPMPYPASGSFTLRPCLRMGRLVGHHPEEDLMSRQNRRADALRRLSARYGKNDDAALAGAALDAVYSEVRERGELSEDAAFEEVEAETERIRRERRQGVYAR